MDSTASHPPGFSHRWAPEGSPKSVSSASPRRDAHVSGLGILSASSGGSVAPRHEERELVPEEGRVRAHDRLVWERPKPSKGKLWTRRIEARNEAGAAGWGAPAPEMRGLCFRCYLPGHRKRDCTNAEVCMRCWQKGHPAMECKRPWSPSSEEELRNLALAKLARRRSPERERQGRQTGRGARAPSPPLPLPSARPRSPPPPPPPSLRAASRLPPMEDWPPLTVAPVWEPAREVPREVEEVSPLLCVARRTAAMCDLEQRLQLAMVATVDGRRPPVSCEQSKELRDHVAAMSSVLVAGAPLLFRPWNRQAQAGLVPMRSRVTLVLEGIPPHAWDTAVVEDLLGNSCAVDAVAPETKLRNDLSLFQLSAWTSDLEAIPVARRLAIPEPVQGGSRAAPISTAAAVVGADGSAVEGVRTLQYHILIHVVRVEEDAPEELGSARGTHGRGQEDGREPRGSGGDGEEGGHGGGSRRTTRDFPWQRGVPDRRRGPGGAMLRSAAVRSAECAGAAPAPEKMGPLPGVASPAPLTIQTGDPGQNLRRVWRVKAATAAASEKGAGSAEERTGDHVVGLHGRWSR
ncbi:hypothetical protein QYE76_014707 [Lolium multiflorum]|uniref:CCHC-type domain-containing protein n=1 Tax=Lolium multiflorum TaxID=4521 RepID=A0AAD8U5H0_LOLMU|nr:hypothetical protein QYE76_014707 [Lolium multiflorum]